MSSRGKIVRDPTVGPGLVMVQGRQHVFPLEDVWQSDALPRPGVVVDVEFDAAGRIFAMRAVPEGRLAREQAEAAIALARAKSVETGRGLIARIGVLKLAAFALLVPGWFWLATFQVDSPPFGQWQVTFWQVLGALNADSTLEIQAPRQAADPGFYGLGVLVCLAAPFLGHVWRSRHAHLAAVLPLVLMLTVALQRAGLVEGMRGVSLGIGAYLSALACLHFAVAGLRRFLVARAEDAAEFYEPSSDP